MFDETPSARTPSPSDFHEVAAPLPSHRRFPVLPIVAVVLLLAWRCSSLGLLVDDSFISFRHAVNFVEQGELVYNLGERVEGISSPAFTCALAVGLRLGVAPEVSAPILGFVGALGCLWVLYCGCIREFDCSPWASLVGCGIVATNTSFCFWTVAGLETSCFAWAFLACGLSLVKLESVRIRTIVGFLLWTILVSLIRTEGLALLALAPALLALRGVRGGSWVRSSIGMLTVLGLICSARYLYYGAWLPNPVYAKSGISLACITRGGRYLMAAAWDDGVLFAVPLIIVALSRSARSRVLGLGLLGYLSFIVLVGGDGLYRYRFVAHLIPVFGLLSAVGLDRLARHWRPWALVLGAATVVGAVLPLGSTDFFRGSTVEEVRDWEIHWTLVGKALAQEVAPSALLATNVAGRIPFYSKLRTLDLLGLADPIVARSPSATFGQGYAGHERASPQYVMDRSPDILYFSVCDGLPESLFADLGMLTRVMKQGSLRGYVPLFQHPEFAKRWRPAVLHLTDGSRANLLIRSQSEQFLRHTDALEYRQWSAVKD